MQTETTVVKIELLDNITLVSEELCYKTYCDISPKSGIVKSEEMSNSRQQLGKRIPAATNEQATIE
jgi:hypothetical protein